jgi:K+-transporting ATPase ATPase C chain
MRKDLITSALAVLVFTVLLGLAYPLVITAISQVAFHGRANGSRVAGFSTLIARPFPGPRYFHPRPSQTGYNAAGTAFSNRGPDQKSAKVFYRSQLAAYLKLERPFTPGLTAARVPVDAVTTSASGVDPHISQANARIQANRVARVRQLGPARVRALIDKYTDGRFLGVFGEPGVNVTRLNLALDRISR